MTDSTSKHHDLRTRIVAVLEANFEETAPSLSMVDMADAVIGELGLEPQVHYDPDCEFYRYVTDWIDPVTGLKVDLP